MAVDRVVALKAPFWHREHSSKHLARKISLACSLFCYALVTPNLYFFGTDNLQGKCMMLGKKIAWSLPIYTIIINYIVFSGVSFFVLVSTNIFFVYMLRKRSTRHPQNVNVNENNSDVPPHQREQLMQNGDQESNDTFQGSETIRNNRDTSTALEVPSHTRTSSSGVANRSCSNLNISQASSILGISTDNQRSHQSQQLLRERKRKCEKNYVVMLLSLTCSFLVLSVTVAIINVLSLETSANSAQDEDKKNFYEIATEIPMIMNNSLNFLFYAFSGRMFRNAFKKTCGPLLSFFKRESKLNAEGKSVSLVDKHNSKSKSGSNNNNKQQTTNQATV